MPVLRVRDRSAARGDGLHARPDVSRVSVVQAKRPMNITREEAQLLGRLAISPLPTTAGELVAVWVTGKIANPLNGPSWVWQKRARYAKAWKERVALALFFQPIHDMTAPPAAPKHVRFVASTWNRMDSDGLQAALKPVRDALVECGVLSGDADKDGHTFVYFQNIDRARRGVEIRVWLK